LRQIAMASLSQLLFNAGSGDQSVRVPAEQALKAAENQNFPAYVVSLCAELGDESKPDAYRQLAGLMLKNTVTTRNEQERQILFQRWSTTPDQTRAQIKAMGLALLGSPHKPIRSTASLLVSKIAAIEIPKNMWQDLIDILVKNIQGGSPHAKESSFETLGYICEEIPSSLQTKSNQILTAISMGMRKEEINASIKLAATHALANSLEFVKTNMESKADRDVIMTMMLSATQSENTDVRTAAYQCLVAVADLYYDHLAQYIGPIFELTKSAINKEQEPVQLQAVEFWCTICDAEAERAEELADDDKPVAPFANAALKDLVPLLLRALTNQSEELEDDETWNLAMASGTCLSLLATTVHDNIVPHVLPFVQQNIKNPNWRFREAAILAFGCILDGPDSEKLAPLVKQAFPLIMSNLRDPHPVVKDSAAWTIGRVCDILPDVLDEQTLPTLMTLLSECMRDTPKVASNACWAVHNLASGLIVEQGAPTSPMSPFFEALLRNLFAVTQRPDVAEGNLMGSAYEAINSLIQTAAGDVLPIIQACMPTLVKRLHETIAMGGLTAEEREKKFQVQGLLAGALQVAITKLPSDVVLPTADQLMTLFLQCLQNKQSSVQEEVLMAIGALANRMGDKFEKYMQHLKPLLLEALRNVKDYHVCIIAVGLTGDLSRALETKLNGQFCDEVMSVLLSNLGNKDINRRIKPPVICCLGDIALAIGGNYERYLGFVMQQIVPVSMAQLPADASYDDVEYVQNFRESICEAYTAILNGLGPDSKADLFLPSLNSVIPFLDMLSKDENSSPAAIKAALDLIYDMATNLGAKMGPAIRQPCIAALINQGLSSKEGDVKASAQEAKQAVKQL